MLNKAPASVGYCLFNAHFHLFEHHCHSHVLTVVFYKHAGDIIAQLAVELTPVTTKAHRVLMRGTLDTMVPWEHPCSTEDVAGKQFKKAAVPLAAGLEIFFYLTDPSVCKWLRIPLAGLHCIYNKPTWAPIALR